MHLKVLKILTGFIDPGWNIGRECWHYNLYLHLHIRFSTCQHKIQHQMDKPFPLCSFFCNLYPADFSLAGVVTKNLFFPLRISYQIINLNYFIDFLVYHFLKTFTGAERDKVRSQEKRRVLQKAVCSIETFG